MTKETEKHKAKAKNIIMYEAHYIICFIITSILACMISILAKNKHSPTCETTEYNIVNTNNIS